MALTTRRRQARTVVSAITELFAADVYAALGRGAFYVPQHRLAVLPRMNQFTRKNALAVALDEEIRADAPGSTCGLFILSQWVAEYRDLADLGGCLREQAPVVAGGGGGGGGGGGAVAGDLPEGRPFMACLEEGWVPQSVRLERGVVVPILGLMEVLAASRLLADTDVLGGGGKNAGFVVERDGDGRGRPLAVRVVKVRARALRCLAVSLSLRAGGACASASRLHSTLCAVRFADRSPPCSFLVPRTRRRDVPFASLQSRPAAEPLAVPLLQVDAGEAFKFTETYNRFSMTFHMMAPASQKLADPRDLQFGNMQPVTVRWALLAAGQRRAFLRTLLRGVAFLRDPAVVEFVVTRAAALLR